MKKKKKNRIKSERVVKSVEEHRVIEWQIKSFVFLSSFLFPLSSSFDVSGYHKLSCWTNTAL